MSTHIATIPDTELEKLYPLGAADLDARRPRGHAVPHQVVRCSDGYFQQLLSDWYYRSFGSQIDTIALPGGPLELCIDDASVLKVAASARLLLELHGTADIWFVFHNGCGGYRFHRGVKSLYQERHQQLQDMIQIEQVCAVNHISPDGKYRLHFCVMRTRGPQFVPLMELQDQARAWGLGPIASIDRDIAERVRHLPI